MRAEPLPEPKRKSCRSSDNVKKRKRSSQEILSRNVEVSSFQTYISIRAEKAKTRQSRLIPISTRLGSILEVRKLDPEGKEFPPEAYVFGNATGNRVKSVRTAWENATETAGLKGLQLRDLRHEAGSRFDEAGLPVSYTSKILGHSNLNTTSRYLNIHRRGLHDAMQKLESHRPAVAQPLHTVEQDAPANVPASEEPPVGNSPTIQ